MGPMLDVCVHTSLSCVFEMLVYSGAFFGAQPHTIAAAFRYRYILCDHVLQCGSSSSKTLCIPHSVFVSFKLRGARGMISISLAELANIRFLTALEVSGVKTSKAFQDVQ